MKPNSIVIDKLSKPLSAGAVRSLDKRRQAGAFAVEFAIVISLFLIMVFTVIEVSRALYMWNTLTEVTRRAARQAASTNFKNSTAMDQLRREAIFRSDSGTLAFGDPVTDKHVVIDYLALTNQGVSATTQVPISQGSLPGCPVRNRVLCTGDAGDSSCVRFIRVRICQPNSNCVAVPYVPMLPLVDLSLTLPISTTIVKAQSLGYTPGMAICQ